MNAFGPPIAESRQHSSQVPDKSGDRPSGENSGKSRDAGDGLVSLGRLLRDHTWRDSRDWADALDRLAQLSEDDLERAIDASAERTPS